jgi:hypothetical protein
MAFDLRLPRVLAKQGWKVKIRDKEHLEEPHVTILRKTAAWRLGLRGGRFLDKDCSWKDFPDQLRAAIEGGWEELCQAWDAMYPNNPVAGESDDDEDS